MDTPDPHETQEPVRTDSTGQCPPQEDSFELSLPNDCTEGYPRDLLQRVIDSINEWRIVAVGNRPQDHMARDLLHGSLLRDARPTLFHRNVKAPPDWMNEAVAHLPAQVQVQALQHLALHFLHRWRLARLLPEIDVGQEETEEHRLVNKLWRCWPFGVEVEWKGSGQRTARDICGLARLCPWCHGRKVMDLYDKILRGPLKDARGKRLVRARASVRSNALGDEAGMRCYLLRPKDRVVTWFLQEESPFLPPNLNHILHPEHIDFVRDELAARMVQLAESYGVSGGIVVYQVGPHRTDDRLRVFRHELALLGEMTESAPADRCLREELAEYPYMLPGSWFYKLDHNGREKELALFRWLTAPAETQGALRALLAGTAITYPIGQLSLEACTDDLKREFRYGIDGALALQPTFMFDDVQWWSYVAQTKGLHLYSPFGTWKGALEKEESQEPTGRELLGPARRRRLKGQRALKQANVQRSQEADKRREQLLQAAEEVWTGMQADLLKQVGRPPLRRLLDRKLRLVGIEASTRDLKWLMKKLQSEGRKEEVGEPVEEEEMPD